MLRRCLLFGATERGQLSASSSKNGLLRYVAKQLSRSTPGYEAAGGTICSISSSTTNRQQGERLHAIKQRLETQPEQHLALVLAQQFLSSPQASESRQLHILQQRCWLQPSFHSCTVTFSKCSATRISHAHPRRHYSTASTAEPSSDARLQTWLSRPQPASLGNGSWHMFPSSLHNCTSKSTRLIHHSSTAQQASHVDYDSTVDTETEQLSTASSALAAAAVATSREHPQQRQQSWPQDHGKQQPMSVLSQNTPQNLAWAQPQQQEFPVYACHLAAEIDITQFVAKNHMYIKDKYPLKDNVVIEAAIETDDVVFLGDRSNQTQPGMQIMVMYKYGSVVFFNMRQRTIDKWRERLQPFVHQKSNKEFKIRDEEAKLVIDPRLDSWSRLEPDKIVVQTLDAANARVISNVLGQSVALDSYNQKVDDAIHQFTPYLSKVAEEGESSDIKDKELLKLIADNSLLYTDVVTKIGLLDISQTAWTQDKYHDLWTALRKDYELDRRFDAINRKLGPLIENAKFLLELRAEQKSSDAEKIIIVLIMLEVLLGLLKMMF